MRRAAWAAAAIVVAVVGEGPLSGIDAAFALAGLFPRAAGGPGLETLSSRCSSPSLGHAGV